MKNSLPKRIVISFFLSIISLLIWSQNKIVDAPNDLYSGTYVYQGTRNTTSICPGIVKTRAYYRLGSTNYYLYADYMNGICDHPNWFYWFICDGLIDSPGSNECIYAGWEDSGNLDPEGCTWWQNSASVNVTSQMSITNETAGPPSIATLPATLVTTTSGTIGANVIADGGSAITARGLVLSITDVTPVLGESGVQNISKGSGLGSYTELISSLTPGTTYYYQGYATNVSGTVYGGVKTFTTPVTSQPNKYLTNAGEANGAYVWIGEYYGKPAWKHISSNYWIYYSWYSAADPTYFFWFIDDELKDNHGTNDFLFYHDDVASCPSNGWKMANNSATSVIIVNYPQISFSDGASFIASSPVGGTSNAVVGRFRLIADASGAALNGVSINVSGSRSGVSNFKLWSSSDANFNAATDNLLDIKADGSTVMFSGMSSAINVSGTYYFITADLEVTAKGSLALTIGSKADLTLNSAAMAGDFSNAALSSAEINIEEIVSAAVNDVIVNEGDGNAVFTISLSKTHTSNITINYATSDNTATSVNDYTPSSGTTTITAGQLTTKVSVPIIDDYITEPDETFYLNLSSPSFGAIADPQGMATIKNDDKPEIEILGNNASIVSGDLTPSLEDSTGFGPVKIGKTVKHTFTIQNNGNNALSLTGSPLVLLSGTNSSDFRVSTIPSLNIVANGSTTFQISFNPSVLGIRSASVSITNNDDNENPYTFTIEGTGIEKPTLTTNAISSYDAVSATLGGYISSNGGSAVTERGIVYSSSDNSPAIGEAEVIKKGNGAGTGSFNELISTLIPGTNYYVQAYAINLADTSYGGVQSFTTMKNQTISFEPISQVTYGDATFSLTGSATSGLPVSYASSNLSVAVVSGNTVTIIGAGNTLITASQAGDGSYVSAGSVEQSLVVTPRVLTINGLQAENKEYDGTLSATLTGSASLSGLITGDDVTLNGNPSALFADATVGLGKVVNVTGYELSGQKSSNYTITQPTGLTADITVKTLTLTGTFTVSDKKFDGTTTAAIAENKLSLSGIIAGDDVSFDFTVAFAQSEKGDNVTVNITSAQLTGSDKGNYVLSAENWPSAKASITASTAVVETQLNELKIYPNPFTNYINIENLNGKGVITIRNILGKKVMEASVPEQKIDTNALPDGIYFLTIKTENGEKIIKMIKRD
jgi:hypothetical protein